MDCLDWKHDVLYKDSVSECDYSEDALDNLISCAKCLTDDIRQITSFIKVIFTFFTVLDIYICINMILL